ncbi:MAG: hypothetical protein F7B61_03215 [Caldisphaeraceae archaeon]|nr:hypothetical protein [Caldisphaeraceae archaeon]
MNWIITLMDSFSTVFFLVIFGITAYFYIRDNTNSLAFWMSIAFFMLFFSSAGLLLYDSGVFPEMVKVLSSVLNVAAGIVFIYIFVSEELTYKTLRRLSSSFK